MFPVVANVFPIDDANYEAENPAVGPSFPNTGPRKSAVNSAAPTQKIPPTI